MRHHLFTKHRWGTRTPAASPPAPPYQAQIQQSAGGHTSLPRTLVSTTRRLRRAIGRASSQPVVHYRIAFLLASLLAGALLLSTLSTTLPTTLPHISHIVQPATRSFQEHMLHCE